MAGFFHTFRSRLIRRWPFAPRASEPEFNVALRIVDRLATLVLTILSLGVGAVVALLSMWTLWGIVDACQLSYGRPLDCFGLEIFVVGAILISLLTPIILGFCVVYVKWTTPIAVALLLACAFGGYLPTQIPTLH